MPMLQTCSANMAGTNRERTWGLAHLCRRYHKPMLPHFYGFANPGTTSAWSLVQSNQKIGARMF